jgi:peptidoglycan/LPS O-acetylase OafA/YrhL
MEREGARRNGWIDVMRGWAVVSVILLHLNIRVPFKDSELGAALPRQLYSALFWSGYYGVIVFFVISGFLIADGMLGRWGALSHVRLLDFYARRFARIVPCLLLFIAVQSALQLAKVEAFTSKTSPTSLPATIFSALTFHLNWLEARAGYLPGAWDVLWSLSIEESFYVFFPLVAVLVRWRWALVLLLLAFVIAGPFARVSPSSSEIWADHSYLSCTGEIAVGCLTAMLVHQRPDVRKHSRLLLGFGLCLFGFIVFFRRAAFDWGLSGAGLNVTLLALGAAALLVAFDGNPSWSTSTGLPVVRTLRWFGRNSYEIYLSHLFLVLPATTLFSARGFAPSAILPLYVLLLAASGVVGSLIARYYSQPLNRRWREQLITPTAGWARPLSVGGQTSGRTRD